MTTLWNDIKYGLRMLAKSPGFTATVVAILALGIGANTVVFSVVNAVLFRSLPYHEPDRIVRIWEQRKKEGIERIGSSHRSLTYWREHNQVFECIAGMQNRRAYLTGADGSYHIKAAAVSSCYFSLMGVQAMLIDENLAHRYFRDVDPIGQRIEGMPIVGVVSTLRDFEELSPTVNTIYKPLSEYCYQISDLVVRTQGDPSRLADALRSQVMALDKDQRISEIRTLEAGLAEMLAPRRFTTVLLGVFAEIVLVLAALGLYGLVQYTVTQCTKEIGIRMALGATQASITKAILRRSALLILLGTGLGLVGGFAVSRLMASQLYQSKPTDPGVLVGTVAMLCVVALVACYLPARRAAKMDPMEALRCE